MPARARQISALRADTIKGIVSAPAFNLVATAGLIITLAEVFGKQVVRAPAASVARPR